MLFLLLLLFCLGGCACFVIICLDLGFFVWSCCLGFCFLLLFCYCCYLFDFFSCYFFFGCPWVCAACPFGGSGCLCFGDVLGCFGDVWGMFGGCFCCTGKEGISVCECVCVCVTAKCARCVFLILWEWIPLVFEAVVSTQIIILYMTLQTICVNHIPTQLTALTPKVSLRPLKPRFLFGKTSRLPW